MAHVNWTKKLYGRGEGGQRVCGGFWSEHAKGSKKDSLCRVGDHEDMEESHDGDDGQRRDATQRKEPRYVKELDFSVTVKAS